MSKKSLVKEEEVEMVIEEAESSKAEAEQAVEEDTVVDEAQDVLDAVKEKE